MSRYRNLFITLVMVLSVVMASGCSPAAVATPVAKQPTAAPATQAPTAAAATEAVQATEAPAFKPGTTITYIASQNWVLNSEMELAKKFEAENGVHVDVHIMLSNQYLKVLQTKLEAGGEGIDIF